MTYRPRENPPAVTVAGLDFRYFVTHALDAMTAIVTELGDDLACRRPDLPGANSPFGLLTHCLGVMEYWGGHVIAGRESARDRDAEFLATGRVGELAEAARAALGRFAEDLDGLEPAAPPRCPPDDAFLGPDRRMDQAGVAMHVYEELSQHLGQMEVLRDALVAEPSRAADLGAQLDPPLNWLRDKQSVKWHHPGPDLLPAWVADMDFPVAPVVARAIEETVRRGDLGYPDWPVAPLAEAFAGRMATRHGWTPPVEHVRPITDLIQALQIALTLGTEPGDGVVTFTPTYPPFLATIASMGRRLVGAAMVASGDEGWTWDHDALERAVAAQRCRVLLLVNPHNPTGHVYTEAELAEVAELARRHDLLVVSDEIHAELCYPPAQHRPFAAVSADAAARTVTVTSASKAFNLAGLRTAVAHVGSASLRERWDAQPYDLFGASNVLGVQATLAAWAHADAWLAEVVTHLHEQRDHLAARIAAIPGVTMRPPKATYLAWLDCSALELDQPAALWFRRHARVELSRGPDFGPGGEAFARLNFATSRAVLDAIVDRIEASLGTR